MVRDDDPPPAHGPRVQFDSLFSDPRHFRGDCRLLRTAIRRGWLDDAPDDVRAALVSRFEVGCRKFDARHPDGPAGERVRGSWCRGLFAQMAAGIELERAIRAPLLRTAGRPRKRWHVSDFQNRIDANELRRRALADRIDLSTLDGGTVNVRIGDDPGDPGERIALAVVADRRHGWRMWLVCPGCGARRAHLYPVRAGVWCRKCAGVGYDNSGR